MTETHNTEAEAPLISLQNVPINSKDEIFKKKIILGSVMLCVIIVCSLIATVK